MLVYFAGTQLCKQKDARVAVGRDVPIMSTFYEMRGRKTQKFMDDLVKRHKKSKRGKKKKCE